MVHHILKVASLEEIRDAHANIPSSVIFFFILVKEEVRSQLGLNVRVGSCVGVDGVAIQHEIQSKMRHHSSNIIMLLLHI